MTFTHVHSSGRYDRPLSTVDKALDYYAQQAEGGLITWTEQGSKDGRRPDVYRDPGWSFYRSENDRGSDECVVQWGPRFVLDGDPDDVVLVRAKGYRPVVATTVPLRSAAFPNRRLIVSVAHLLRRTTPRRKELWDASVDEWVQDLRARRRRDGGRLLVVADWNVNLRRLAGRALVLESVARPLGLRNGWGFLPPKGEGTHGGAVIDGDLTDLTVVNCRLLRDQADSDHSPYATALDWPGN